MISNSGTPVSLAQVHRVAKHCIFQEIALGTVSTAVLPFRVVVLRRDLRTDARRVTPDGVARACSVSVELSQSQCWFVCHTFRITLAVLFEYPVAIIGL